MNRFIAALCLVACSFTATADGLHPWIVPAPRLLKETYFSNVRDGDSIETPFVLKFGLTGMGLAPIVQPVPMTGHHHLLVNRELPLDFTKPLPFNDQYIHFGKGQMETVLTFPPGKYQLRLVLADDKHIPDFVYSKPISITVTKKNDSVDAKTLSTKGVAILLPHAGEKVTTPFRVAMHASKLNVSNVALHEAGSGHFRLRLKNEAGREEIIALDNGYTEVWLKPPAGSYTGRVEFIDNATSGQIVADSQPVSFKVER
jgi:hypothetical protein